METPKRHRELWKTFFQALGVYLIAGLLLSFDSFTGTDDPNYHIQYLWSGLTLAAYFCVPILCWMVAQKYTPHDQPVEEKLREAILRDSESGDLIRVIWASGDRSRLPEGIYWLTGPSKHASIPKEAWLRTLADCVPLTEKDALI